MTQRRNSPCSLPTPRRPDSATQITKRVPHPRRAFVFAPRVGFFSRLKSLAVAALAVWLASILVSGCHSYHVDATIENRTGASVQLLEVDYPSASFGVDRLDPGATFHYRFQVLGSGPLSIQYTDSNSHPAHISGPTLAEGQHGRLQIVLLPEAKATFQMQLTPAP